MAKKKGKKGNMFAKNNPFAEAFKALKDADKPSKKSKKNEFGL